jgi:hypothetical protein
MAHPLLSSKLVSIDLEPGEGQLYEAWLYGTGITNWFLVLEDDGCFPTKVAVEPVLLGSVLSVIKPKLFRANKRKPLPDNLRNLIEKLLSVKQHYNMATIDITKISTEELAALEEAIKLRKAEDKKLTSLFNAFSSAAQKEGYQSLDAALDAAGWVKKGVVSKGKKKSNTAGGPRKPRTNLTEEMKGKIVEALKEGSKTTAKIAEEFSVSTATISKIKADSGLTKK